MEHDIRRYSRAKYPVACRRAHFRGRLGTGPYPLSGFGLQARPDIPTQDAVGRAHQYRRHQILQGTLLQTQRVFPADNAAKRADDTAKALRRALEEKKRADRRPVRRRPIVKTEDNDADPLEVDLHIDSLLDTTAGMSPADILNYQVDTFRRIMDANLRRHGRRIIFIHGKGEGKLRQALIKELEHRYRGQDIQDASFQKYGFGATQVTIR